MKKERKIIVYIATSADGHSPGPTKLSERSVAVEVGKALQGWRAAIPL